MLDDDIKQQLSAYLERVKEPFELVASLADDAPSLSEATSSNGSFTRSRYADSCCLMSSSNMVITPVFVAARACLSSVNG